MLPPTITIVICARNAAAHLRRSIPAAFAQNYPPGRFKVLVIDNASTDDTAQVARDLGAVVRPWPRPGVAGARQFGWKISRSRLIAYLDADCEPPPHWLATLAARFTTDPRLAAAGVQLISGPVRTLAEEHIVRERLLDTDRFRERNALSFPFLVTAGLMVRRQALEDVGGFDLSFGRATGEDADLCWRLERAGWRTEYVRDLQVIHHHRSTLRGMMRQAYWYGRSSAAMFAKWRGELGWWRYTDRGAYRRLASSLLQAPGALLTRRGYHRVAPLLRLLEGTAFLAGKLHGAMERRVLFF